MADQFSKLYDVERVGGDQRQRLAELLRSQGMNAPQGQMVGNWYVKPSWSQNLNSALQMGLGTYMGAQLDEERKAKTAEILRDLSQGKAVEPIPAVQNFNGLEQQAEGQTPMQQQAPQNELERLTRKTPVSAEQSQMNPAMAPKQEQRYVPLTEEEKIGKVMELAQYNPAMANIWSAQDTARQARLAKIEDIASQREWQGRQNELNRQSREDMIRLGAMLRPTPAEPMVSVLDAQGNATLVPRSQAAGMTPFTPAAQTKIQQGKNAAVDVQNALNTASDVFSHEGKNAGTGWTSWTQAIPSTEAKAFGANLNTFKAQGFLSAISSMRGMGALSDAEGKKLIDSVGALDPSQSTKDFDKGLKNATKQLYDKARAAGIQVNEPDFIKEQSSSSKW